MRLFFLLGSLLPDKEKDTPTRCRPQYTRRCKYTAHRHPPTPQITDDPGLTTQIEDCLLHSSGSS